MEIVAADDPELELGGIDLDEYCRNFKGAQGVVLDGDGAFAWRCKASNGRLVTLDMNDACRKMYDNPNAYAKYSDPREKYSWSCFQKVPFGAVSLGNPPIENPGRLVKSCEGVEDQIDGEARERSKVWSLGGSPEKYRFDAEWVVPAGRGFLDYMSRELGASLNWDKGQLYLYVDMYYRNGELFDTQDHLRLKDYTYYVTSGARAFGTIERSSLSIPNGGTANIYMFVERAGFDLDACWLNGVP
ncbi:MAG: hypothetical protein U0893_27470 [Chloroflexota bacterium]